jgi:MFS transporter, PAT family, solute carrier family 33 (acetyl-CoA transportor), member 1
VKTFFLWLVDIITWKSCIFDENALSYFNSTYSFINNKCIDIFSKKECTENGGRCNIDIDGYYIEVAMNVVYGIIWLHFGKQMVKDIEKCLLSDWHVLSKCSEEKTREVTYLKDKKDEV